MSITSKDSNNKRQKKKKKIFDIPVATIEKINQVINPTKH